MNEMLASYDKYSLYKVNNKKVGAYYLCVPRDEINDYQMFLGFIDKDFDKLSKDDIISEVKNVNDIVQMAYPNAVYVIPVIPINELEQAVLENDNRVYNNILVNRIQPITADVFRVLIEANHGVKKMAQSINVVKNSEFDKKFSAWLVTNPNIGRFFNEINFDELKEYNASSNISIQEDTLAHTVEHDFDDVGEVKVRTLSPNNNNVSPGFSNIKFIIITLIFSLFIGIVFSYILIK